MSGYGPRPIHGLFGESVMIRPQISYYYWPLATAVECLLLLNPHIKIYYIIGTFTRRVDFNVLRSKVILQV